MMVINRRKGKSGKGRKQHINIKQYIKTLVFAAVILCVAAGSGNAVIYTDAAQAVEASQDEISVSGPSQIMTTKEAVDMKSKPDAASETLMSYEQGASVFVTGQTDDGWYRVSYQDKVGYVPADSLRVQEIDVAKLDEEMENNAKEAAFVTETVEKYRKEAKYDKIWFSMIIVLVAGIFTVGIVSAVRTKKRGED